MKRFCVSLAVLVLIVACAERAGMPVVGFLRGSTEAGSELLVAALRQGLSEAISKARTLRSNIAGPMVIPNGSRPWRPIWSAARLRHCRKCIHRRGGGEGSRDG